MPTQCTFQRFDFGRVEGRRVAVAFDGGAIPSDAGALLRGPGDRAIGLVHRRAACFPDRRDPELVEPTVPILGRQRVFGLALG